MKRSFKGIAVVSAVLASLFFAACSDDVSRASNIDTYKLDAVSITVKAYPGFNYVSWGESTTSGAVIKVLRDDGKTVYDSSSGVPKNSYIDAEIINGQKYTYTAYVIPSGNEVTGATTQQNEYSTYYAVKGNSKSASATAIRPAYYTSKGELVSALDLVDYENDADKNYVISNSNLFLKTDADGNLVVTFPTKSYLKYSVSLYKGNAAEEFGVNAIPDTATSTDSVSVDQNFYTVNNAYKYTSAITAAGVYQAVVKVEGWEADTTATSATTTTGVYAPSYVTSSTITIDALDIYTGKNTSIITTTSDAYIDEGETIRVVWTPAKKSTNDNEAWASTNYTVYEKATDGTYTALEGTIGEDTQAGETVYYIDYAVEDNTIAHTFYVVLSDNGKYESSLANVTVNKYTDASKVGAPTSVTASFTDLDEDYLENDAVLSISVTQSANEKRVYVDSVKYKIVAKDSNNSNYTVKSLLLDSELTEVAAVPSADYTKYDAIVENVALDSKVVFLYTLKQEGKKNYSAVVTTSSASAVTTFDIATGEFSFASTDTDSNYTKGKFTVTAASYKDYTNYSYEVYYARLEDDASIDSVTSWTAVPVTLAWDTTNGEWTGKSSEITFTVDDEGGTTTDSATGVTKVSYYKATYAFKYVKTNKNAPDADGAVAIKYDSDDNFYVKVSN